MKKTLLVLLFLFSAFINLSFASPKIRFAELLTLTEQNPELEKAARTEAVRKQLPVSIITKENKKYDVKFLEDGKPVYSVITNFADVYKGGYTAFYEEISSQINFSEAKVDFGNGKIFDYTNGYFNPGLSDDAPVTKYLMVLSSSADRIYLYNAANGDLIDTAFTPTTRPQFDTPIHAIQHFNGKHIIASDQLSDQVFRFDEGGNLLGGFAPIGGVNNNILDNIRGICYRSNNNLLVTVGAGTNINTIQQFDTSGNHLGTFINSANLNSPFYILIRQNDILVANSSGTNDITRFDLSGNFLSNFHASASLLFPQQMIVLPNTNLAVSGFSIPSGIVILDSSGTYIKTLSAAITGNRGLYLLGNGHYLTTNGGGVHEVDSTTGALIRSTINTGQFRYISEYVSSALRLTLTINFEACSSQDNITVELRNAASPFNLIESRTGKGGSGIKKRIEFSNAVNGTPYYIVVKHRYSVSTWSGSTQSFSNGTLYYDFTSASSQAYGNNMINSGGKWSFYAGDVNQDDIVDASDVSLIDNDALTGNYGTGVTDINCDAIVDVSDLSIIDNNSVASVQVIAP